MKSVIAGCVRSPFHFARGAARVLTPWLPEWSRVSSRSQLSPNSLFPCLEAKSHRQAIAQWARLRPIPEPL